MQGIYFQSKHRYNTFYTSTRDPITKTIPLDLRMKTFVIDSKRHPDLPKVTVRRHRKSNPVYLYTIIDTYSSATSIKRFVFYAHDPTNWFPGR